MQHCEENHDHYLTLPSVSTVPVFATSDFRGFYFVMVNLEFGEKGTNITKTFPFTPIAYEDVFPKETGIHYRKDRYNVADTYSKDF